MKPTTLALLASALGFLATGPAHAIGDKDIDVLVVFPEKLEPSKVYFATDGEFTRGLLIPFAALANSATLKHRSDTMGAQLDNTLDGYDRYATIFKALEKRFKLRSDAFKLVDSRAPATYFKQNALTSAAGAEGYDYVLEIDDKFSGLSMLNQLATRSDDLAPATMLGYKVYDARKRNRIAKGATSSNGLRKRPYKEALEDRDLFVGDYERIADILAIQIVGTLFRTDKLHAMAASVGRGEEVPPLSAVMKRYEKRFDYRLSVAKDWKNTKMNSKFVSVLEPRSDLRFSMGLRFEVDLLIPELGQDIETLDEYVAAWHLRLVDEGIDMASFKEFTDIDAPEGFRVYALDLPGGGRQISLVKMLNEDMLQMMSIIIMRDFDTLYPQNRKKLEAMLAAAKLELH